MKKILLSLFFVFLSTVIFEQGGDPFPAGGVASAPIDSGILAMLAGGVVLGLRKWKQTNT